MLNNFLETLSSLWKTRVGITFQAQELANSRTKLVNFLEILCIVTELSQDPTAFNHYYKK